jgi:hypothetical protein
MNTTEVLKLALDDLIAEYHMQYSSFARRVDDIFKEALVAPEDSSVVRSEEYKSAVEVSIIFHEGQRMFAVPKQPAPVPLTDGVTVPMAVLEAAEASLGSFCSDLGWSDEDMQNMDNLSAYIARHKANLGITKGQS